MAYIAHIRESDKRVQTVEEHLLEAKKLAESYGEKIGVKHITGLAGLLHDLGKYTDAFRNYILEAVYHPELPPKKGSVDHSTAGGKLLFEFFHSKLNGYKAVLAEIVGNAIISHHSYLQDFLSPELDSKYLKRVQDKELEEFEKTKVNFFKHVMSQSDFLDYVNQAEEELKAFLMIDPTKNLAHKLMFLTKFIFSALIDADRTNTRLFEENKLEDASCDTETLFNLYYDRLMLKINSFKEKSNAQSRINLLRSKMSDQCDSFAGKPSGIYTLSIPTGGGKTLASLRYALKHAKLYGKKHIIYVVPYTTIIEQNAEEVRKILQDDANILEHHSNVVEDDDNDENQDGLMNLKQRLKLAKDNWNVPIIFTTMVQFLNVFYEKGSRNIRRLHNMSEAVLIFDEVQKVPVPCVSLFNEALNFLKTYCHSSILLCTATQPALDFVEHKLQVNPDAEIVHDLSGVIQAFKRVEIIDRATNGTFNTEKLCDFIEERIQDVSSMLVILNTKGVVKKLYEQLKEKGEGLNIFHLSTSMCAAHRNHFLKRIRSQLAAGEKIICVSTQLIEAGVDVSFDCVIRSLAGLDSIAQAAGRCNRHGEKEVGYVYVIDHEEENLDRLQEIKKGKNISKKILIDLRHDSTVYEGNILSTKALEKYFKEFYTDFEDDLNYNIPSLGKNMTDLLTSMPDDNNSYAQAYLHNKNKSLPLYLANSYFTAAEKFHVIDDRTTSVLVPYEDGGKEIISELNSNASIEDLTTLMKKAQQFTINLYRRELERLQKNDGLVMLFDGKILALKEGAYDKEYGLNIENDSQLGFAVI